MFSFTSQTQTLSTASNPPAMTKSASPCKMISSPKILICSIPAFFALFVLFQIRVLQTLPSHPWDFVNQWGRMVNRSCAYTLQYHGQDEVRTKLRESVTFLPLKDLRFANKPMDGHTWFMSSINDTRDEGVEYMRFPSEASKGRILCLKGRNIEDGAWNGYALAWTESLPPKATLLKGRTFIAYNDYIYDNIWHGMSAMMPFVAWYIKSQCRLPDRWILYHKGELRTTMAPWVTSLTNATFEGQLHIENFDSIYGSNSEGDSGASACFEEAMVMRKYEGEMPKERRMQVYDLMRCKARLYCNVTSEEFRDKTSIGMTLFMRDGKRSWKDPPAVLKIFQEACRKVDGCTLRVAHPHNLTFCGQVKLMSQTDIMVSPHGAAHTNMILMNRNSSVMEFYPKGWLEYAGIGQYIYLWLAERSGMRHQGAWRDPIGPQGCDNPAQTDNCMVVVKDRTIGHNETYFKEWAAKVLEEVKRSKAAINGSTRYVSPVSGICGCK